MTLADTALEVWNNPRQRVHLDWYDGPVQSILIHAVHGPWYVFALQLGAHKDRLYALRPLVDASLVAEFADQQTLDETNWLERVGLERLLPGCADEGVFLHVRGDTIEVREMLPDELQTSVPRPLHAILNG